MKFMTNEKNIQYKKSYVELNEILKLLAKEQKEKIPENFINNISNNMDKTYKFTFDKSKGIFEQDLMVETEALLVEIYERYLAPEEEKELWQKYDRFCLNKIEEKKKEKYNKNIFENNKKVINQQRDKNIAENIRKNDNILPIEYKKENLFERIINFIKTIFLKK